MKNFKISEAIATLYPTKDWVISDFVVTDPRFGAKAEAGFDNRAAFQAAIDAAHADGGGVVYIPAGNYEFRSTVTGSKRVTLRDTGTQEKPEPVYEYYDYEYVLNLPPSVQLRGDRACPEANGGKVLGTVLEVRVGKNSPNYDGYIDSDWRDSQAGNVLRTTKTSIADRFIQMNECTGVTNLSIWYPEQEFGDIQPYPWTLYQVSGDSATMENVTLVNSYNGFYSAPAELHYVVNSHITALNTGVEVHICTDIGRIENTKISPTYWAKSGLPNAPSIEEVTAYTRANATGFKMHRSDWEYVSELYVYGCKTGMWVGREPGFHDAPNANFYGLHMENCATAIEAEAVNPYGLLISDSVFKGDKAVNVGPLFDTSIQFNGVEFQGAIVIGEGSGDTPLSESNRGGVVSFESCSFDYSGYDITVKKGAVLLAQCTFADLDKRVHLEGDAVLREIPAGKYEFEPIPKNIIIDIPTQPRAAANKVIRVDFTRAKGENNDRPSVCVADDLQAALDMMAENGGGTVYLPGGRYLIDKPVIVPEGVELRGSWDVQHHTQGGGTAIFTNYGIGNPDAPPLIQLKKSAGLRGLTIVQLGQQSGNIPIDIPAEDAFFECPFLIQGQGADVYIINVTLPNADKGIDLASFNTDRHYVEYLGGSLARAGIWVGGGASGGFIRNVQFNPHYGSRLPHGGQGYPTTGLFRFQREYYSALKFGDVKNQTIFFNFVFGSKNGIHFLKDAITGKNPKELTVIGHGTDGSTFGLFVEDADADTRITLINSELVTLYSDYKAYVLMGEFKKDGGNPEKVHKDAVLTLYNSAFWGNVDNSVVVNSGVVRLQQANIVNMGDPVLNIKGGRIHVYNTYFQQGNVNRDGNAINRIHAMVEEDAQYAELTNNYYASELRCDGDVRGMDVMM